METEEKVVQNEQAKFSLGGATLYGINAVIGSGIFLRQTDIYKSLGAASILVMAGAAIMAIMLALCFAEVSGYFNKNGGAYQYSKRAFGDFVGFNVGVLGWIVTMTAWSAMAAGFAKIFISTFPAFTGWNIPISLTLVLMLSLMNIAGIKTSKIFTLTATVAKLIPIIAFAVCTLFFLQGGIQAGNFTPFLQLAPDTDLFGAVGTTAVAIFYSFIGFETLPIVAGEMRNAEKNVPRAILGSISTVSLLYLLILSGTIAMLGNGLLTTDTPVQDAFTQMIGPIGGWIVAGGILVSIAGLNIGESVMVPRFGAAIAEDGLIPRQIAKTNKNGAPVLAVIISGTVAALLLLTGTFEELATLSVVFRFFQYIPTALAVLKLRKEDMGKKPVFRVPFGPVIPVVAVVISVIMLVADNALNIVYGAIGLAISVGLYFIMHGSKGVSVKQ